MSKIAIIGAGLSGMVLANELSSYSEVTVFEKARGVSGRMSTRYATPYQFDHGAQFFTAKTPAFQKFVKDLVAKGIIARWDARLVKMDRNTIITQHEWDQEHPHYVGLPKMNQIVKHLAVGLKIKLQSRITNIGKEGEAWQLWDEDKESQGIYDWVISTTPPAQSADLLPESFVHYAALQQAKMSGCFTLMLGFPQSLPLSWDAAFVENADIGWVSVNSSKSGRPAGYSLLINSTNAWAERHLDDDREEVQKHLCRETSQVIGHDVTEADYIALHGWRYANIDKQSGEASLIDTQNKLGACGDWCIQGRVEAAFTSAMHLANQLKTHL